MTNAPDWTGLALFVAALGSAISAVLSAWAALRAGRARASSQAAERAVEDVRKTTNGMRQALEDAAYARGIKFETDKHGGYRGAGT